MPDTVFGLTPADLNRIGAFVSGWMRDAYGADNPDAEEIATRAIMLFIGAAQERWSGIVLSVG